ncbi:uncharacterized protein LAJ45_05212 [Morchella importuna]|uniref:uncharacterized protein n=1 Tax=Morchella importuna TaxID=1174673 RepID=UPI001E8D7AEC|nr:uncharacterized protein LAJ45_05212 [Morchella importuna]KAH8150517.1 hypothetical protein LAJ45_05212 [Morchella importuna]
MATSTRVAELSPANATILAAHFAASGDLKSLRSVCLLHSSTLRGHTLLRVLLCLPETTQPTLYIPLIRTVLSNEDITVLEDERTAEDMESSLPITKISDKSAQKKIEKLPTLPVGNDEDRKGLVTSYLLQRSRNIDSETGALSIIRELLTPFRDDLPKIRDYLDGSVEVLSKLVYEYAQENEEDIGGTAVFETMEVDAATKKLLNRCGRGGNVVQDLKQLVVPYLNYRGSYGNGWGVIWKWLEQKVESGDWAGFVEVIARWDGPENQALREQYARLALTGCYICGETESWALDGMRVVEKRVRGFVDAGVGARNIYKAPTKLGGLLDKENPLTAPNTESLKILDLLITSAGILAIPLAAAAKVKFEGSHDDQKGVLTRYVRNGPNWAKRSNEEWKKLRNGLRWMRSESGVLEKLSVEEVEKVLLSGMLAATKFPLVKEIYVTGRDGGLGKEEVERSVLDAFQEFYDNASNGNKTRGGVKNALNILQILYPQYSNSTALERAFRLVNATHALSHYSLTITPGVLLRPVHVRIHADPLSLLARLLDSNPKSYTQADNLTNIAKDLCFGTTGYDGGRKTNARVLGMCIDAALSESDFDTAYSFSMNRLVSMATDDEDTEEVKDVIWRTCFQAGRYRSPYAALIGETSAHGGKALRTVEMRMELLGQALRVCPPPALAEVLAAWRRCEEEMQAGLKEEEEEEERHAALWKTGDARAGPGRRKEDEAPMGLFAVAREAAQALRGSTFPLAAGRGMDGTGSEHGSEGSVATEERIRKRDMVSGMVTHGLASGLGWVLGAQPAVPPR